MTHPTAHTLTARIRTAHDLLVTHSEQWPSELLAATIDHLAHALRPGIIPTACRQLAEQSPGVSANPNRGRTSGRSDPTANAAVAPTDPIDRTIAELDRRSIRLAATAHDLPRDRRAPNKTINHMCTDARMIRFVLADWARAPDIRWCAHCLATNGYKAPVDRARFKDLCRPCGTWKAANGRLPQPELLEYLQRSQASQIPDRLLARYHAKLPRRGRR